MEIDGFFTLLANKAENPTAGSLRVLQPALVRLRVQLGPRARAPRAVDFALAGDPRALPNWAEQHGKILYR